MRRNIYDVLKSAKIDLKKEYSRIYNIFFVSTYQDGLFKEITLEDYIDSNFHLLDLNLVGRCLSLRDFNESYGYRFAPQPNNFNIDVLIDISEYVANFVNVLRGSTEVDLSKNVLWQIQQHIDSCMGDIGYKRVVKDNIIIYIENNPNALAVAETSDGELAYSVLEYNHFKMKGDLKNKRGILKNMADDIENDRRTLNSINKNFTSDLFQLMNKFIRHDCSDNLYIAGLTNEELEDIYDDIYQMWLMAKMQLEQVKRNKKIASVIEGINNK